MPHRNGQVSAQQAAVCAGWPQARVEEDLGQAARLADGHALLAHKVQALGERVDAAHDVAGRRTDQLALATEQLQAR